MQNRRAAGFIYGPEEHHLDHLAGICILMHIPLIVTDEEIDTLAKKYYPQLELLYYTYSEVSQKVAENYDILFSALPRILIEEIFFLPQRLLNKKLHSIWCPHGNSDKGHKTPFMEGLDKEEIALVYGQKMKDFLQLKGAFDQLKAWVFIGNLRFTFYKKEKSFYQELLAKTLKVEPTKKIIIYAPTWEDSENSSSFFSATPLLIDNLPKDYSLIIKLHPHLLENPKTEHLMLKYESHPRVQFIKHFPPVYPLLDKCDIYIGDMSSVGYDFLSFDKPMFFLNETGRDAQSDPGLYLYRCGVEIPLTRYDDIYKLIELRIPTDKEDFSKIRKEVYKNTFGEEKKWESLYQEILNTYYALPDPELDFL